MMENVGCIDGYSQCDVPDSSHLAYAERGIGPWNNTVNLREEEGLDEGNIVSPPGDTHDPLKMYLHEISATQLLKRSEELEIAKRIRDGKDKAIKAVFSLPFSVHKLLLAAEMVKQGKSTLSDIVQSEDAPGDMPGETEKRFLAGIRQVARLYQQGTASSTVWSEKIPVKIIALRPRFAFVRGLHREIEEGLLNLEEAGRTGDRRAYGRKRAEYKRALGSSLEEVKHRLQEYAEAQRESDTAKMLLVQANLRLVVHTARRYAGIGTMSVSDLIQEGNIGLMRAAELFDHRKGFKFSTYATCWIKQSITRALSNNSRMIRLPVHTAYELSKIIHTSKDLIQESGNDPTPEDIAVRVKMPTKKVQNLLGISREPLSLSMSIGEDNAPLSDYIEDRTIPSALEAVIRDDLRAKINSAIGILGPKEKRIVKVRYGIGEEEQTLETLAQEFGVTRERIRQIEMNAIKKLKVNLALIKT